MSPRQPRKAPGKKRDKMADEAAAVFEQLAQLSNENAASPHQPRTAPGKKQRARDKSTDEIAALREQLVKAHAEIAALRQRVDSLKQPAETWGTLIREHCERVCRERGETFDPEDVSRHRPSDLDLWGFCAGVVGGDISECLSEECLRETAPCFFFLALRFLEEHATLPTGKRTKGPYIAARVDTLMNMCMYQDVARRRVADEEGMEYTAVAKLHQKYGTAIPRPRDE